MIAAPLTAALMACYFWLAVAVSVIAQSGSYDEIDTGPGIAIGMALELLPWLGLLGPFVTWAWAGRTHLLPRRVAAGAFNVNLLAVAIETLLTWFWSGPEYESIHPIGRELGVRFALYIVLAVTLLCLHVMALVGALHGRPFSYRVPLPLLAAPTGPRSNQPLVATPYQPPPDLERRQTTEQLPGTPDRWISALASLAAATVLLGYWLMILNWFTRYDTQMSWEGGGDQQVPTLPDPPYLALVAIALISTAIPLGSWLWARTDRPLVRRVAAGAFNLTALTLTWWIPFAIALWINNSVDPNRDEDWILIPFELVGFVMFIALHILHLIGLVGALDGAATYRRFGLPLLRKEPKQSAQA